MLRQIFELKIIEIAYTPQKPVPSILDIRKTMFLKMWEMKIFFKIKSLQSLNFEFTYEFNK